MTTEHKITADGAAAVTTESIWMPIDANTPRGVTMWMINKRSNVAQKGQYHEGESFFDHWFPLPTFDKKL
jgi:hypothetical protein